ncbi:WAT1-related protein At2g37460-like [Andrographis paniculata]|uniref:WAT1-related protein At2g37460-like n=1 Tax=Andrographis paniculata TaxID=175694 RepID=UPI0021E875D2|nr:WAT1-related protein At2g37460-like [Andrographis paniculata]
MVKMDSEFLRKAKVYVAVIFLQIGNSGFAIVAKGALDKGTSHFTLSVYRNAIAALIFLPFALVFERKIRPRMTLGVFAKILLLSFLDPIMGQNLFYVGMNITTATFAAALCNLMPSLAFVMAWILRVEKVKVKDRSSQAKIVGTLITLAGAMIMTFISGRDLGLPWTHADDRHQSSAAAGGRQQQQLIKGALIIFTGNFGYALFFILQAITLQSYPAGLSLTALICTMGAVIGTALTFMVERGNTAIWALGWDSKLLAYAYGGIMCSGISYYISGVIMKTKGPVFVTAFNPLSMVIVAALSSFVFAEQMNVGKVTGATVIVIGLYLVIWGKIKDEKAIEELQTNPSPSIDDDENDNKKITDPPTASHAV